MRTTLLVPLFAALAAAPSLAVAGGSAPTPLAAPAQKKLKEAIARGRALAKKGDHPGAIKAFQEALAVAPEDPTALSELGLAAFKAKDLALAEQASRKSVAYSAAPALRAASLYNLGRVQEARGETAAAVDSYRRSLEDRPNKIVRERLTALDPKAAAAVDPVAPAPMEGPFPSLADFCKATAQRGECDERSDPKPTYTCDAEHPSKPLADARGPLQAIVSFTSRCEEPYGNSLTSLNLAVNVAGAWWVAPAVEESLDTSRQSDRAEIKSVEVRDVIPGGAPEALVRSESSYNYRGMSLTDVTSLRVVGLGPTQKPGCTPAILLEQSDEENDEEGNTTSQSGGELRAEFLPDGKLEIKGPFAKVGRGLGKETLEALLGVHTLTFP